MTGEDYTVEGFAVPDELESVHALLSRVAADHPEIDPMDVMLFETAVIEIANNVVEYGEPEGEVRWRLTLRVTDDEIQADLDDTGQEFEAFTGAVMPGEDAEGGRGLAIAESMFDKIELERADGLTHWTMVRKLGRGLGL